MISFVIKSINKQKVRYLISGGTAAVTNLGVLFILVDFFHIWYLIGAVLSFMTAMIVGFILQKFFAFNDHTKDRIKRQSALYIVYQLFNLGLNTVLMYVGVDLLHMSYIVAQMIIFCAMTIYSYLIYKYFLFTPKMVEVVNNQ